MEDGEVVFGLEVPFFLRTGCSCVPVFPFLLLFLVSLFYLRIFESEFQCLQFSLLAFLHILGVIRKDFEPLWNFELSRRIRFDLFFFLLLWRAHGTQPMQLDHFLCVILLIFYQKSFLKHFLYYTGVKFAIS